MIFTGLLSLVSIITVRLISYFPEANSSVVSSISSAVVNFKSTLSSAAWIVPIDTLFLIIQIVITIELSILTFRVVRWILSIVTIGIAK